MKRIKENNNNNKIHSGFYSLHIKYILLIHESKESQNNVTSPGIVENINRNLSIVICHKEEGFFIFPPPLRCVHLLIGK